MKFIKRRSTDKIVHRESPYTEHTIDNAVTMLGIDKSDLEIVDENWTEDEWTVAMNNQLPYGERRKSEYPDIGDQLDALYHAGAFPEDMAAKLKAVKDKYPKK